MPWVTYETARRRARREARRVLLVFTCAPAEPSSALLEKLESDQECRWLIEEFYFAVKVHTRLPIRREEPEERRRLKERFAPRGYPTMIVTSDGETSLRELLGSPGVEEVRAFLREGLGTENKAD
jgi:hypothetical protein